MADYGRFTEWLRAAVRSRGLSLREIGERSDISASTLSALIRGRTRPSMETVFKLAKFFAYDADKLLVFAGYEPSSIIRAEELIGDTELDVLVCRIRELRAKGLMTRQEAESINSYLRWAVAGKTQQEEQGA